MDHRQYEKDWPGLPVEYLIISSKNYIVFLDDENDLDWQTSDEFDKRERSDDERNRYNEVKNEIDKAECVPLDNMDVKIIINYKKQLGEALVRAFDGDFKAAKEMVEHADSFLLKRSVEQSRYMFLTASGNITVIAIIILIPLWVYRNFFSQILDENVYYILLATLIGSLGALLSVILRTGKINIDYNASRKLHYLEGGSRIIAGMISALIVAICIKTEIILPVFSKIEETQLAMMFGALIAGSSERFAPSIISKLEQTTNSNK